MKIAERVANFASSRPEQLPAPASVRAAVF
jgi:hypothetical protein